MGGGQANSGQASSAFGASQAAADQSKDMGAGYAADASKMRDLFFGTGGTGTGGTLGGFLDPKSLDVTAPTGAFKTNYENSVASGEREGDNAFQSNLRSAAGRGLGVDSNALAFMGRQNSLDRATMKGQAFSDAVTSQHNEALQNFWGATNTAAQMTGQDMTAGVTATGNAAQTNANLYGTAGAYHQSPAVGVIGAGLGAAGAVGAGAMTCPTGKSLISIDGSVRPACQLTTGSPIVQHQGWAKLPEMPEPVMSPCVMIKTHNGMETQVAESHCFELMLGGYVEAVKALNTYVKTDDGAALVTAMIKVGEMLVYPIKAGGDHSYLCDGFWSLE